MYSDKSFFELVRKEFTGISKEFNFTFKDTSSELADGVDMDNGVCTIILTYRLGETGCMIKNPKAGNDVKYHPATIYKYLYPNESLYDKPYEYDVVQQVHNYSELLKNRLTNVLLGDFSWSSILDNKRNDNIEKVQFIHSHFSSDHPIVKKFWNGDFSWEDDLENYLKDNNISLPG